MADEDELTPFQRWSRYQQFVTQRETGIWLLNRGQPRKGFPFLENALQTFPKDIRSLTGRAQCKLDEFEYEEAIRHAAAISAVNPSSLEAEYLAARALYELGDFEESLVVFHRGRRARRTPGKFESGRQTAEETIEDCVGRNAGPILVELCPEVRLEAAEAAGGGDSAQRRTSRLYLGSLRADKETLARLRTAHELRTSPHAEQARALAAEGHGLLARTEEIMQTIRPLYTITRWHERPCRTVTRNLVAKKIEEAQKYAVEIVDKVTSVQDTKDIKVFLRAMDVAVGWLKSQAVKWVPDREQLLGTVFDVAGKVYLRQKSFSYEHFTRGQENRVTRLFLGLPVAGRSQVDAAFDKLNKPLINCRQVTGVAREMLRSATSPAERCYHLHALAMCASLSGRYGPAISDARRCADEAHGAGLASWQLNGLLLLFRSLARHGRKVEALYALDEAEGVARPGDMHDVLDFIEECRRVLDEPEDERSPQHIEMAREEGLLKMMRKVGLVLRAQKVVKRLRSLPFAERVSLPEGFDPASKLAIFLH